jgi:superfamily I DNA and/or RNA helicase
MPSNEEHSKQTLEKLGISASDLHIWMDEPSKWAGYLHRFYRHDPNKPPKWAIEKYGSELTEQIMHDHLELDEYEDYNTKLFYFLKSILISEIRTSKNRSRARPIQGEIIEISEDMVSFELESEKYREGDYIGYLDGNKEIIPIGEVITSGKSIGVDLTNHLPFQLGQKFEIVELNTSIGYEVQIELLDKIIEDKISYKELKAVEKISYSDHQPITKTKLENTRGTDGKFELDESQLMAVEAILGLEESEIIIIVGPPGTGKTEVIAKAAMELSNKGERILVTSHTNRAVDNVVKKLPLEIALRVGKASKISPQVRKYALGKRALQEAGEKLALIEDEIEILLSEKHEIYEAKLTGYEESTPVKIRHKSRNVNRDLKNKIKLRNELIRRERNELLLNSKIIGATLISSALSPLDDLDFDTIFIDECSQVPISLALLGMSKARKYVIIGDHKQLLPIFQILNFKERKKEIQALSAFNFFKEKYENRTLWLRYHYRCNNQIIDFSCKEIYENRIIPVDNCKDIKLDQIPAEYHGYYLDPNKPVIFIDIVGRESYEQKSRYNAQEIEKISEIIHELDGMKINMRDIGIITTFRAQRDKLKQKIRKRYLEISTVDSYQGREKDVIIYSVTGTRNISFIEDENRLNVAFTRARKKLIVLGNAKAIQQISPNGLLSKYIDYAKSQNGFFSDRKKNLKIDILLEL